MTVITILMILYLLAQIQLVIVGEASWPCHAKYKRLLNARPADKALAQNANEPHND
jgi:hypothetical protein